ncbi:hypothetical protein ROR02_20260 [Pararhodospirillum oryzae]|uniref:Antifreeze glycopeptide polyprotein n=2 Tax=Pararhodospirillum oryzae TaxID=478448 RepID=A0A512H8W0_9PROT|nr:hypothetical protein ROR02_20260 [Pararhodospirillum oryzae]
MACASAGAQDSGPVRLFPLPAARPQPALPPALGPVLPGPEGVEIRALGGIDLDAAGLLTPATGGLAPSLWQGLTRPQALALLDSLAVGVPSPALTALARRVLLTSAAPPPLEAEGASGALIARRADLLFRLGLHGDVATLLGAVSPMALGGVPLQRFLDALLLQGRVDDACATVVAATSATPPRLNAETATHAQRVRVLCQVRAGESEAAALGMAMLRETGAADEAFLVLAERIGKLADGRLRRKVTLDPVTIALFREASEPFPRDAVPARPEPWLARAVALSAPALPAQRLAAAEWAVATGALGPDALAFLYADMPLPGGPPAGVVVTPADTPEARAALTQSLRSGQAALASGAVTLLDPTLAGATAGPDPAVAAPSLAIALAGLRARDGATYLAFVRALGPTVAQWPARADLIDAAPEVARALYAAGERVRAQGWVRLIDSATLERPDLMAARDALLALDRVGSQTLGLASLLPLDPTPLTPALEGERQRLEQAARQRRQGEVALRTLVVLGQAGGPSRAPLGLLASVAQSLEAVDLADVARDLITEALAVRG